MAAPRPPGGATPGAGGPPARPAGCSFCAADAARSNEPRAEVLVARQPGGRARLAIVRLVTARERLGGVDAVRPAGPFEHLGGELVLVQLGEPLLAVIVVGADVA